MNKIGHDKGIIQTKVMKKQNTDKNCAESQYMNKISDKGIIQTKSNVKAEYN